MHHFYIPKTLVTFNFLLPVGTEDTSEIFYEDGISFIPLRNWSRAGKFKQHYFL